MIAPPPSAAGQLESGADPSPADGPCSWRSRILGAFGFLVLRIQAATWRTTFEGLESFDAALAARRRLLVVLWHGTYVPLFAALRNRRILVFSSRSRRGEVISEICRRFGYRAARIPDRGGTRSLDLMRRALADEVAGAIVVDGPLGPPHEVKRGAVVLASEQGRLIFPVSVASSPKRIVEGRWDQMELPRLFSRVAVVLGAPLEIPPEIPPDEESRWQATVKAALVESDRRAEASLDRVVRRRAERNKPATKAEDEGAKQPKSKV